MDIDPAEFLARLQGMSQQKGQKSTECRQCGDRGVVPSFDEQAGNWTSAPCPSCTSLKNWKAEQDRMKQAEAERKQRRPNELRQLATAIIDGQQPVHRGSDIEGRCTDCGYRSCQCDYTIDRAHQLAKLILEHLNDE